MKGILASDTKILQSFLRKYHFRVATSNERFISYESSELTELLILTGASGERAYRGAQVLGNMPEVTFVLSVGTAASLNKTVRIGSIVLCDSLKKLMGEMALWSSSSVTELEVTNCVPMEMLFNHIDESERNLIKGSIVTAPHIATNSNMRTWLGRDLRVDSIDQDAAYTASACSEMSMPFAIIRGITSQESGNFPQSRYQVDRRSRSSESNVAYTPHRISEYIKFRFGRRIVSNRMNQILTRLNSISVPESHLL